MSKYVTKTTRIQQIGKVITGSTPPTGHLEYFGDEYLFIKPSDVGDEQRYVAETETKLSKLGHDYIEKQILPRNSICVVCIGTLGKICMTKEPSFTNQQINGVVVNESKYNPLFIYYLMKLNIRRIKLLDCGSASGRENVNKSSFESIELEIPELPIQEKIAASLSAFDDLIELNLGRIRILQEFAQRLYDEWFVYFRYPGHEEKEIVQTACGAAPKKWEIRTLEEVCEVIRSGGTPSRREMSYWKNGTVNWFKTKELNDSFLFSSEEKIAETGLENSSARLFDAGTILMAIYAAPTVGRLGILTSPSSCNQAALGLRANPRYLTQQFLFFTLKNLRNYFNSISLGVAQQNISAIKVKKTPFLLPEHSLVDKFESIAQSLMSQVRLLHQQNRTLKRCKDILIPNLISGQIDVNRLEI
jgi:type I restriction enzyme S subunit